MDQRSNRGAVAAPQISSDTASRPENFSGRDFLLTRREALCGGLSLLGFPGAAPKRADACASSFGAAKTVVLLWMDGGLPHLDTFDPKPGADRGLRGPFGSARTCADGVEICDQLPELARHAEKFAILRGVSHGEGGHERARHLMQTGCLPTSARTFPDFGALLTQHRAGRPSACPPVFSKGAKTAAEQRLEAAYGASDFGQACLLARRGAEAGLPFVSACLPGWDTHENHFPRLQNSLLPDLDRAFSALLGDLSERGLLASTLVVCMGEFGRSPAINANRLPGRDHWPAALSVVLAGSGVCGGQALGATDAQGMAPLRSAILPGDLIATICHLAGIPSQFQIDTSDGLPSHPAAKGRLLREIFG